MKRKPIAKLMILKKQIEAEIKRRRDELEPGTYEFNGESTRFFLEGKLTVGEDYQQRIVNKAKPWAITHVLMQEINVMRAAAGMTGIDMDSVVRVADTLDKDVWTNAKEQAEATAAAIKDTTWTTCKGKTTFKGNVK